MSKIDQALTSMVLRAQKVTRRFKRNGHCKLEPSENMKHLWELNPDLDREAILNELKQRRGQLGRES